MCPTARLQTQTQPCPPALATRHRRRATIVMSLWALAAAALPVGGLLGCTAEPVRAPIDAGDVGPTCPAVTAPGGAEPDFAGVEGLFLPMAKVRAALDKGARFIFVDARPSGDYALSHILGAVSLPFFDASACAKDLPLDVWYITYCGCPHAESSVVAKAIIAAGGKAKVLDEGYFVWKEAGHPVDPPAPVTGVDGGS